MPPFLYKGGLFVLNKFRRKYSAYMIQQINNEINSCSKCKNNFQKKKYFGNTNAKILIINENASNNSEVFDYLIELINSSDLDLKDVFFATSVACITTRLDLGNLVERCPSSKEVKSCKNYLDRVIDIIKPKVIISLGATALNQFKQGSNLLEHVETTQYFNGIPTLINFGSLDLFKLNEYKTEEEMDTLINSVINTFDKAAKYIKEN